MVPEEADSRSIDKEKLLAMIDIAMGGHVAEAKFIGAGKLSSGAGSDLQHATRLAREGVRRYSMFQEKLGLVSAKKKELS